MENIREVESVEPLSGEVTTHIIIDRGNGEFTSMLKSTWDELEAKREQNETLS